MRGSTTTILFEPTEQASWKVRENLRTFPTSPASLSVSLNSRNSAMRPSTYLVFGDLHGRVLPAFRLAQAWSREHGVALAGLLQVGDLGDSRFDRDTKRHEPHAALQRGGATGGGR